MTEQNMNQQNNVNKSENIIEVKNLIKKFGEYTAVDNVSFEVKHGQVFAFLGPNGAGKTTTIRMLTTMLHPTFGTVRLNGFDPVHESNETRKSFGIVFQDASLDNELTAYENMKFHAVLYNVPKEIYAPRIEELMKLVELWDRKKEYVKNYSGGMKRRLEIARGLLHHPKVLFLDEPTLGLDPQTRNKIWDYIGDLNKKEGLTVFFTTHYMQEADRYAEKIAVIDHGKIVASGSSVELQKQTGEPTLEDAFLALTGTQIRDEAGGTIDRMRVHRKAWGGGRN
jgi:ABC-2 type transport system ATP-binding protein